jgi:thiosulfate dehydrogenase [quinone] large subunit
MQTSDAAPADVFDRQLAYAILRVTLGVNMLMHGAVRLLGGLDGFAAWMVQQFAQTPLPAAFVRSFALPLPFIEIAIGLLLLLGVATRWALAAGGLLMVPLVFGTSLRSDWNTVLLQMVYALIYYLLLTRRGDDAFTLGSVFGSRRAVDPRR